VCVDWQGRKGDSFKKEKGRRGERWEGRKEKRPSLHWGNAENSAERFRAGKEKDKCCERGEKEREGVPHIDGTRAMKGERGKRVFGFWSEIGGVSARKKEKGKERGKRERLLRLAGRAKGKKKRESGRRVLPKCELGREEGTLLTEGRGKKRESGPLAFLLRRKGKRRQRNFFFGAQNWGGENGGDHEGKKRGRSCKVVERFGKKGNTEVANFTDVPERRRRLSFSGKEGKKDRWFCRGKKKGERQSDSSSSAAADDQRKILRIPGGERKKKKGKIVFILKYIKGGKRVPFLNLSMTHLRRDEKRRVVEEVAFRKKKEEEETYPLIPPLKIKKNI